MHTLTTLAGLALVAGLATGCGGGSPTDASEKDFCAAFGDYTASLARVSTDDTTKQVKAVKDGVKQLADVGTPDGIPDDARDGYELFTKTVADLDDDATEEQINKIGDDLSDSEEKQLKAFETYVTDTCSTTSPEGSE